MANIGAQYGTYKEFKKEGENLWSQFITDFMPQTIKLSNRSTILKWYDIPKENGVYLGTGRRTKKSQLIIDIIYHEKDYPPMGYEIPSKSSEKGEEGRK